MKADQQKSHQNYEVVFRILELLRTSRSDQTLKQIACALDMSESQLNKVLCSWAHVDSNNATSLLTLSDAENILQQRIVDLAGFFQKETSTQRSTRQFSVINEVIYSRKNVKSNSKLKINWAWCESAFGPACVMATEKGICGISFAADYGKEVVKDDLMARWSNALFVNDPAKLQKWAASIFDSSTDTKPSVHLMGTSFQIAVWNALLLIPFGNISTYSEIAKKINYSNAVRAVGSAVGANPVSWLIPCHRVLRKTGGLGGYHWGLPIKHAMLAYESIKANEAHSTKFVYPATVEADLL